MVKVYLLCLDAYPETPELAALMESRKLKRSHLICAGTEIIDGGIGYNTLYKADFYKWRTQNSTKCIVERLVEAQQSVIIHNHVPWFSKVIGGTELSKEEQVRHYREHVVDHLCDGIRVESFGVIRPGPIEYSSTNPDMTLNTFVKWNFPQLRQQFYDNERAYIEHVQARAFSGLFITDLCHWHEHVYYQKGQVRSEEGIVRENALNDSITWLANWNFDEPDSVFFIFADHSHRVEAHLDPPSHMTWVYFKDNRSSTTATTTTTVQKALSPIVASTDFYPLVEQCFNLPTLPRLSARNPFSYDPRRVYKVEDGRSNSLVKDQANAFGQCTLVDDYMVSVVRLTDSTTYPARTYVMITTLANRHTFTVYAFDDLTASYVDAFSIECANGLATRNKTGELIYPLTSDILQFVSGT